MRLFNIFFVLLFTATIISCTEDEPKASLSVEDNLEGTWNLKAIDYSGTSITSFMGVEVESHFTGNGYDMNYQLIFDKSLNTYESLGTYSILLEYVFTGQTQTTSKKIENIQFADDGSWSIDNGNLIITPKGGEPHQIFIDDLNSTTFKMRQIVKEIQTQGEVTITTDIAIEFVFER